jgi:dolichyl-phosphooligosaccharide-protein glycotransferase
MLFSIWIRGLSSISTDLSSYSAISSPDIWYNFRQIELMIHHFPQYAWFDPMTAYPLGKSIDWGPLLPFIASSICILFGMTSRHDMMVTVSWIGPLFASFMVPLLYLLGKRIWDWKIGIVSAGLISILSGIYFIESVFGNVDHHFLETFTSTLFCLFYLYTLFYWKTHSSELKKFPILIAGTGFSIFTGILYFIGYLNMPTIILFGFIIAIYTLFQFILDNMNSKRSEYLLFTNIIIFFPVIFLMLIFGIQQPGVSFEQYSIAQIYAISGIIVETILFYYLSYKMKTDKKLFLLSIPVVLIITVFASRLMLGDVVISQLTTFFGQNPELSTIIESQSWSYVLAFNSYNFALVLASLGFVLLLYELYVKKQQEHLFFAIWSIIIFLSTVQHLRFEYYFVVNIALLSSLCIVSGIITGLSWLKPEIGIFKIFTFFPRNNLTPDSHKSQIAVKKNQEKRDKKLHLRTQSQSFQKKAFIGAFILVGIILISILTVAISIQQDLKYSINPGQNINNDWVDTLEWLPLHTPDPGVEYFGIYQKSLFHYPNQSYGVLAWWDNGHYITFISKRIPNTNPFQDNVMGSSGAAAFFMADSEYNGSKILDVLGTRYVITDTSITTDKFPSIATWYNSEIGVFPYMKSFYIHDPIQKNKLLKLNGEFEPYFQTISVRLHNFDGSMIKPTNIIYLEYYNENRGGLAYPIVTKSQLLPADDAKKAVDESQADNPNGKNVIVVGQFLKPLNTIPALQHFRLIHESPGNSSGLAIYDNSKADSLNFVKVFEYVPGAHIKGNGVIELKIITNTGREIIYQQESIDHEFIVPYSTQNNPYDVKTNGTYHIIGINREIEVTEEDVLNGREIAV